MPSVYSFESHNSLYLLELGIHILQVATSRIVLCFCVCIHFPLGYIAKSLLAAYTDYPWKSQ